jgi:ring-1,2-phenylacetyl-CoA epoxidase subunit PaaE
MHLTETCVAFAADAGIESALPIVKRLLDEKRAARVLVFCGADSEEHAEPVEELLALKDRYLNRLSLSFVMNREPDEAELLSGRLDASKVAAIAAKLFDSRAVREYYVFGPTQLAEDVSGALIEAGVESARIHRDVAGAAIAEPAVQEAPAVPATAANETRVEFVMDGRRRSFSMQKDESILDAAARSNIDLPFSCKAGVCSTCRTKLVRGRVELAQNYALEDWELEQGFILACQAHATTPEIELTYDEK